MCGVVYSLCSRDTLFASPYSTKFTQNKFIVILKLIVSVKTTLITAIVFVHFSEWDQAYFCFLRHHLVLHKVTHEWLFGNLIGNENYISYCNIYFTPLSFSYTFLLVNSLSSLGYK